MRTAGRMLVWLVIVCLLCGVAFAEQEETDGYTLEQVLIFSRHNIRAPLSTKGTFVEQASAYEWTDWSADAGELTDLGTVQEVAMGEYFRNYFISEGLMEKNEIPEEGEVRVYANSYERTIATARAFTAGLFTVANVEVEYHMDVGTMDPVFKPALQLVNDAYLAQVNEEMAALCDGKGLQGVVDSLAENIALLEQVTDFADTAYAQENGLTALPTTETVINYVLGDEPRMKGDFKNINSLADALVMQYYEQPDDEKAAFGEELTFEQWQMIGAIQDAYVTVMFCLPSVAVNVEHNLLMEMAEELETPGRKLTYLCGHDSNVAPLLAALGAESELSAEDSRSLTPKAPIGCKIVVQKWLGADGEEYASLALVYQSAEKLRSNALVSLNDPPVWAELSLAGLEKNADGLYRYEDVLGRFEKAIAAFDDLPRDEAEEEIKDAA